MNPGLIPPADVAAAAKKGLDLREKFRRGGTRSVFIAPNSSPGVETSRCEPLSRLWGGEHGRRWADSLTARINKTAAE